MNRQQLVRRIEELDRPIFRMNDLRKLFPDEANLKVTVKRMLDAGVIFPVARGIFTLKTRNLDIERVSTQLYYPSYISFESALSKYGVINQGIYGLTLATTRHSKKMTLAGVECEYSQLKPSVFTGFELVNGTYLARPEKACLDLLYLISLGKRHVDPSEWMVDELDVSQLAEYLPLYPAAVGKLAAAIALKLNR